jgi:ankyrin repeat protein
MKHGHDHPGFTALLNDVHDGWCEGVLDKLAAGIVDVNDSWCEGGETALIQACNGWTDCLGMVELLLESKAAVDLCADDGTTPLLAISRTSDFVRIAATLITAGADIDRADNRGLAPVHAAAAEGNSGIVQLLLHAGALSTNIVFDGYSPLHAAVLGDHLECVELLTGFRPNTPGWATFLAGASSKKELAAYLSPPANRPPTYLPKIFDRAYLELIWKFQRERYSDLHLQNGHGGCTALQMAASHARRPTWRSCCRA